MRQASYGIVDVQEYHNLKTDDLAKGLIKDPDSEKEYMAATNLTVQELVFIANSADDSGYLDRQVEWLQTALKVAQMDRSQKDTVIPKIR